MNGLKAILCCVCVTIAIGNSVRARNRATGSNDTLRIDVSRGLSLYVSNDEARITLRMSALFTGSKAEARDTGRLKFKKGILKKIGTAMMMAPLMMQLFSLPATLASIKMSLLRSIFVGKIAIAVMLYSALKSSQKSETVVVHRPVYHKHFYHGYEQPEDEDDDDGGWWTSRGRSDRFRSN